MNKNIIKLTFLILALGVISVLSYQVVSKTNEKNAIENRIKTIPEFSFVTLNNEMFDNANLDSNLPTAFLYFNSECDFCQYEAQSINESINKFNNIQLVFVSTEPIEKIKAFSKQYNLNNKENIIFLYDSNDTFSKIFNANSIPFTLIYSKKQRLIKTHKGQLNAVGILRIINEQK